jgi:carbohydrate-binding DOMON domain-containing protein
MPAVHASTIIGPVGPDGGRRFGAGEHHDAVGGAIGVAVLAPLAAGGTDADLARCASEAAALNAGFHLA